jgi:hypothetical protein
MPDERAVITCVSSYYHTFSGAQKVREAVAKIYRKEIVCLGQGRDGSYMNVHKGER